MAMSLPMFSFSKPARSCSQFRNYSRSASSTVMVSRFRSGEMVYFMVVISLWNSRTMAAQTRQRWPLQPKPFRRTR